jgi:hypothetical protein
MACHQCCHLGLYYKSSLSSARDIIVEKAKVSAAVDCRVLGATNLEGWDISQKISRAQLLRSVPK